MVWNARAGERGDDVFVTNNAQFMAIRRAVLLIADIGKGLRLAKKGDAAFFWARPLQHEHRSRPMGNVYQPSASV